MIHFTFCSYKSIIETSGTLLPNIFQNSDCFKVLNRKLWIIFEMTAIWKNNSTIRIWKFIPVWPWTRPWRTAIITPGAWRSARRQILLINWTPTILLGTGGPSLILDTRGPLLVLGAGGPLLVLGAGRPSVILGTRGPSVILGTRGPSVVLGMRGPSVVLGTRGPVILPITGRDRPRIRSWSLWGIIIPTPAIPISTCQLDILVIQSSNENQHMYIAEHRPQASQKSINIWIYATTTNYTGKVMSSNPPLHNTLHLLFKEKLPTKIIDTKSIKPSFFCFL